jgi:hypothetical protein
MAFFRFPISFFLDRLGTVMDWDFRPLVASHGYNSSPHAQTLQEQP